MKTAGLRVSCYQGIIKDHLFYFILDDANAFCILNLITETIEDVIWIDQTYVKGKYYSLLLQEEKIILIPGNAESIMIYDMRDNSRETVEIDRDVELSDVAKDRKFFGGFSHRNGIYIFGYTYPMLLNFSISEENSCDSIQSKAIYSLSPNTIYNDLGFMGGYCKEGDEVYYVAMPTDRAILKIDVKEKKIEKIDIEVELSFIYGVVWLNDALWIFANLDGESVLLEWSNGIVRRIVVDEKYGEDIYWWNPIAIDKKLYIFSMNKLVAYVVDVDKGSIRIIQSVIETIGKIPNIAGKYRIRVLGKYQDKILFCTGWNRKWYEYDLSNDNVIEKDIYISDIEYKTCVFNSMKNTLEDKRMIYENGYELNSFLSMILSD